MAAAAARLRLPDAVQDAALAVFVVLFQIRGTALVTPGQEMVRPLAEPGYLGYALLAVSGLALVVRRKRPVAVLAVVAVISVAYYVAGYPDGPGWVALFVALYTVTAQGDGRRSVWTAAGVIAALTAVWLLTADLDPLNAAGWVFFRVGGAVMAAALGESVRGRRVLAEEAQERAERAERTREEEAARRVDAERLRIAREVHDTIAHALSVINVQAGVTAHVLDRRPDRTREALETIERTSARALHELRATLGVLREAGDDRREPPPGLHQLGELAETARAAGLDVAIEGGAPGGEVPDAVQHAAYRIVQESLTNAVRHAGPSRVTVSVGGGPEGLEIVVTDDGLGGRVDAGDGRGVPGMRERAALLGGEVTAGPLPGGGWQVRARLPLQPDPAARS
jgi:signal transduction histidine kinase